MFHDLTDNYKSRDYTIAITLREGEFYGYIFYEYNYSGYGLSEIIMQNVLHFTENLTCQKVDELNSKGLLINDIGIKADVNVPDLHFKLRNKNGDILEKTILESELQNFITGYQIVECKGHGNKKERRKCISCQNFKPVDRSAKGLCDVRKEITQRSRIICAFDYSPKCE